MGGFVHGISELWWFKPLTGNHRKARFCITLVWQARFKAPSPVAGGYQLFYLLTTRRKSKGLSIFSAP